MSSSALFRVFLALSGALGFLFSASIAFAKEDVPECFDALVRAKIVRQTPSVFPDCGPDCIIMVWPWFLELDVKRVITGEAAKGRQLTLAMQHTSFRRDLGARRWWLRRNSLGGFNVLRIGDGEKLAQCTNGTPPMASYISPGPDKTLDDLLRAGEEAYKLYSR